jgi:hypothetical protein
MNPHSYASSTQALTAIGFTAQQRLPDQLIVSAQRVPVWPNRGNSFWLSRKGDIWYLATWLPACFRFPPAQDVVALCSACMSFGTSAMYTVPDDITTRFALERISDTELDRLFPDSF